MSIADFINKYGKLANADLDGEEAVAGRIMKKRPSSSKLKFYDLHGGGCKIQLIVDASKSELDETQFSNLHDSVKRGDIVGVIGCPGNSKRGELSIFPKSFMVLSHCLHMLPMDNNANVKKWVPGCLRQPQSYIVKDQETRYAKRFVDLIMNGEVAEVFKTRAKVISYMRSFLDGLGFLEVETPIMNTYLSIGAARPFIASNDELNLKFFMRIAPELQLKQLVVGGFERVYEIGKQFRCENVDMTHHPEFTSCEFYMAYADYNDLIGLTEELLSGMVEKITGSKVINCHSDGKEPIKIDFTPPFRRIDLIKELEELAGLSIPQNLYSEEARKCLLDACQKEGLTCEPSQRIGRLLDELADHYLGETCVNPTFIMNHPILMSPLAKHHRSKQGMTERFELFVNKRELINAYTELNDPVIQRQQFVELSKDLQHDHGAMLDENFCESLEYGLPPTAGWGLGIDRLVMLITDSQNIKEVLLFPQSIKKRKRENEV